MTIEYQETRFGRKVGQPKPAEAGTKDWIFLGSFYGSFVGKAIRVDSHDKATVTVVASGFPMPVEHQGEAINEQNLQSTPFSSFTDLVLWRRRHYSWKPTEAVVIQHSEQEAA